MKRRDFITGLLLASATQSVRAQEPTKQHRIAIVIAAGPVASINDPASRVWQPFWEELRRLGDFKGQNLAVEGYSGGARPAGYADLAREVGSRNPDLIVAISPPIAQAVGAAAGTIPIVASGGCAGLPSLARLVATLRASALTWGSRSMGSACRSSRKPFRRHPTSRSWICGPSGKAPTDNSAGKSFGRQANCWKSRRRVHCLRSRHPPSISVCSLKSRRIGRMRSW